MKKIILRLLSCLIVLGLLAALTVFVVIPLFSEEETEHLLNPDIFYYEGGKKALTMENDQLTFELDPKALRSNTFVEADGFRVTFEEMGIENPRAGSLTVTFTLSEEGELLSARLNAGYRGNIGEEAVEMTVESYELFAGQNTVKANIPEEVKNYPTAG